MTKTYLIVGPDHNGAFTQGVDVLKAAGQVTGNEVVVIQPVNGSFQQAIAAANISPPANVILYAHGAETNGRPEPGAFVWSDGSNLQAVGYDVLYDSLPVGIETISIASCYGGSAHNPEYTRYLKPGTSVVSLVGSDSLRATGAQNLGISELLLQDIGQPSPADYAINALDNFDLTAYKVTNRDLLGANPDRVLANALPHRITIGRAGGPQNIDLDAYLDGRNIRISEGAIARIRERFNLANSSQSPTVFFEQASIIDPASGVAINEPAPIRALNLQPLRAVDADTRDNFIKTATLFYERSGIAELTSAQGQNQRMIEFLSNPSNINSMFAATGLDGSFRHAFDAFVRAEIYEAQQNIELEERVDRVAGDLRNGVSITDFEDRRIALALVAAQLDTTEGIEGLSLRPPVSAEVLPIPMVISPPPVPAQVMTLEMVDPALTLERTMQSLAQQYLADRNIGDRALSPYVQNMSQKNVVNGNITNAEASRYGELLLAYGVDQNQLRSRDIVLSDGVSAEEIGRLQSLASDLLNTPPRNRSLQ